MIYAESGKFLHPNYKNEQLTDKKSRQNQLCIYKN